MKKLSLIIFILIVVGVASCKTMENNNSLNNSTYSQKTSENSSSQVLKNSTTSITKTDSINSKSSSSKEESSKTADEKMYEYVRNHQVTTKKATNMTKSVVISYFNKMLLSTSSSSREFNLPNSLIFTKGNIECIFEQTHVLSKQGVHFKDFVGEFDAKEKQAFLSQFPQNCIKYQGDTNSILVLYKYRELFNTQKNAIYISLFGSRTNTFNASLGTAAIDILIYEKEGGKYAFEFSSMLNNPDYLIGELEIQSNGSAKAIN